MLSIEEIQLEAPSLGLDRLIREVPARAQREMEHVDRPSVVRVRGACKSFSRGTTISRVLENIDLDVKKGECVFLVGPSGSGKTTLLSLIGCVLGPDSGTVEILGQDVSRLTRKAAADLRREKIGFVFQRLHLIRGLSAAENVALPLTLGGWRPAEARRRAADLLATVKLQDKLNEQPHRLSLGQCQRVAFARALAAEPDLILADEPTASLDAAAGQQAMQLLRHLTVNSGKSVIVVTHDSRILPFADRVLHLENGRITGQEVQLSGRPKIQHET